MNSKKLIFFLAQLLVSICNPTVAQSCEIRGVSLGNCEKWTEGFICPSTKQLIPADLVNDDYCDCPDSLISDEPGTSACSNSRFHCENVGSYPRDIRSSIVNDGVCDCCDGTDEWLSNSCANECVKEAEQTYQALRRQITELENALSKRDKLVKKAGDVIRSKKTDLKALKDKTPVLKAALKSQEEVKGSAQASKDKAEKEWFAIRDKDKDPDIDSSDDADSDGDDEEEYDEEFPYPKEYKFQSEEEKKENEEEIKGHEEDSFPYPEEYKLKPEDKSLPDNNEASPDTSTRTDEREKEEDCKPTGNYLESCKSCQQSGCTLSCKCNNGGWRDLDSEIEVTKCENFAIENELGSLKCVSVLKIPIPAECQPKGTYLKSCENCDQEGCTLKCDCHDARRHKSTTLDLLTCDTRVFVSNNMGVLECVSPPDEEPRRLGEEIKKTPEEKLWIEKKAVFEDARQRYEASQREVDEKEKSISKIKEFFDYDLGDENILASFSECLSVDIGKYTYEICPFDKVTQNEGKSSTDLGRFKELNKVENGGFEMVFHNGKSCWGGPKRSTTVEITCGSQEIIDRVEEPATCVYRMQVITPAVCSISMVRELKNELNKLTGKFPILLKADIE